jgi:hypothetical protein
MLLVYLVLLVHERHKYRLVTRQWHMLITGQWHRLVQVYNNISHSDQCDSGSIILLIFQVVGWGKDRWLYPPFGCSWRT